MLSIRDIVDKLNEVISEVLPKASKLHNIAYPAKRGEETLPSVNEKYVGIDNTFPIQLYHKINGIQITKELNTYNRNQFNYKNTYSNSIIVFNNQKRTKLNPDELALLIQTVFPKILESENYKSVKPSMTSVILNSQSVFSQEYKGQFKLSETESLFQINYSLEVVFDGCLDLCPEDFLTHKN